MSAATITAGKENNQNNHYQRSNFMLSRFRRNDKGFTLVEVIVVAVIVAVLALVGVQLYQGYVSESRRNTAENLAASAASYLQTIVNSRDEATAEALGNLDGAAANNTWTEALSTQPGAQSVTFTCPNNATVTVDIAAGTVSATVDNVPSTGVYKYKFIAGGGG